MMTPLDAARINHDNVGEGNMEHPVPTPRTPNCKIFTPARQELEYLRFQLPISLHRARLPTFGADAGAPTVAEGSITTVLAALPSREEQ
jgi:hypothetical protein